MTPPRSREEELFSAALELPPGARNEFLSRECGADSALRASIEMLLGADAQAKSFMASPAVGDSVEPAIEPASRGSEMEGDRIGRYKLLQRIGEGGCGIVYLAEQEVPVRRRVALKIIKLGMDTKEVIARFEAEQQALAVMDHPNIAKVHDAGATETGRPYFVMELVRGVPITKYCNEHNLTTTARLELFTQVCHALHHAHQKGIIHRDVKPSNILVARHDDVAVPKVIDFGIAKATHGRLTDHTLFTAFEQFIGTPAYMSPEQAEMSGLEIDARSDIYSLGVLLYELLTGRPPFDPKSLLSAGLDEIRRIIREIDPPRPSARLRTLSVLDRATVAKQHGTVPARLSTLLRGDLDWVVMKALEKDRTRRYETASALAQDLLCYLRDEPVAARPPNAGYRFQKFVRRNKFAAAIAAVLTLIGGLSLATWRYIDVRVASIRAVPGERVATSEPQKGAPDAQIKNETQKVTQPVQVKTDALPVLKDVETIFNDTFSDGERFTQNLPNSAAWYLGQTAPALSVRKGVMELVSPGHSSRGFWAYFPLLTLKVGEAVTFSCDFTFEGEIQNENFILRIGLCHTNGVAPRTSDGPSPTGAYQGYASLFNGSMGIAKRDGIGAVHPQAGLLRDFGNENKIWRILGTGNGPSLIYRSNVPYTTTFTIVRTSADTVTVTSSVTDVSVNARGTITWSDSSNIFFNFDTVGFYLGSRSLTGVMRFSRTSLAVAKVGR